MKSKKRGGYRWREGDQVPTRPVTIEEIMSGAHFMLGVSDVRAGRGYRADYDTWRDGNFQWEYDRGRLWATLAPKTVPVKRAGKVTPEAIGIYMQHLKEIL